MVRDLVVWSPTGGLFAVATSIFILAAIMLAGLLMPARYQFAASSLGGGQAVWRGDTITGHAELCGTETLVNGLKFQDATQTTAKKC